MIYSNSKNRFVLQFDKGSYFETILNDQNSAKFAIYEQK